MAKPRIIFACKACGSVQTRWMGKCPDCNAWDTLEQETLDRAAKTDPRAGSIGQWTSGAMAGAQRVLDEAEARELSGGDPEVTGAEGGAAPRAERMIEQLTSRQPARRYPDVGKANETPRMASGIGELDRVLGGGLVPASAVLIGGDPGIGKSTLLLQAAASWVRAGCRVLYVSSEESVEQVKLRAERLLEPEGEPGDSPASQATAAQPNGATRASAGSSAGTGASPKPKRGAAHAPVTAAGLDDLFLLSDSSLTRIVEQAARVLAEVPPSKRILVIDSVQMVYKPDLAAFPGSMSQLRQCCAELVYMAKATGTAVVFIGHVTKEGNLAGPKLLEHLVDAVLYVEGDRYHAHRVLRCVKNRFGSTLELGLFEMTDGGLREALGTSAIIGGPARSGSVICPVQTGTRCLLLELQALTATSFPGMAKRKASGIDANRLAMLIAVLEQHGGLRLEDRDIFVSSVGGVKVTEPASDLALALAIAGAHFRKGLPAGWCAVGEVGLGGELRPAAQLEQRILEAAKLGCQAILIPQSQAKKVKAPANLRVIPIAHVGQAIEQLEIVVGPKPQPRTENELEAKPAPQPAGRRAAAPVPSAR